MMIYVYASQDTSSLTGASHALTPLVCSLFLLLLALLPYQFHKVRCQGHSGSFASCSLALAPDACSTFLLPLSIHSAWLKDHDHPAIRRISKRIEDMSGLTMSSAEDLQVRLLLEGSHWLYSSFLISFQIANYGIGGHYDPHFDFARVSRYDDTD